MCTCHPRPRLWKTRGGAWICSVCGKEPPPPARPAALCEAESASDLVAAECACCGLREAC